MGKLEQAAVGKASWWTRWLATQERYALGCTDIPRVPFSLSPSAMERGLALRLRARLCVSMTGVRRSHHQPTLQMLCSFFNMSPFSTKWPTALIQATIRMRNTYEYAEFVFVARRLHKRQEGHAHLRLMCCLVPDMFSEK